MIRRDASCKCLWMKSPFRYFKTSPGIIRLAVMTQVRFPLSLRNVEDLRKLMKRYPRPDAIITDRLRSYRAALRELGGSGRHQAGRWLNNRAENSHLPFRRREHAMLRFRRDAKPPEICRRPFFRPTTTSTCGDASAHGTISRSTAPLHLPSGVNSGRPNSLLPLENSDLLISSDSAP